MKKLLVFAFVCFAMFNSYGQDVHGKAFYHTESINEISIDPVEDTDSTKHTVKKTTIDEQALNDKIRRAMQKEYELAFNRTESLYKEIPKLKSTGQGKELEVVGLGGGSDGGLYKNTAEMTSLENRDVFGKLFLLKDKLEQLDWTLDNETKQIGTYTCYKATAIKEVKKPDFTKIANDGKPGEKIVKTTITAWYTPSIPISQGPAQYWGLPGFILEVSNDRIRITCSKIILNPTEEVKIKKPCKGKKTNKASFKKMYNEKLAEMMKMSETKRKKERS